MTELSDVEVVALGTAIKDKRLSQAKASLPDGKAHAVDFCVRVTGSLQKGTRTQDATVEVVPTVDLRSLPMVCAVLCNLGIGPKRLAHALRQVDVNQVKRYEELEAAFAAEEQARAAKLPKVTQTTPGRAGAVQSQVTATRLEAAAAKLAG